MTDAAPVLERMMPQALRRFDPAVVIAFGCILVLLLVGALYSPSFLSPAYLLQQLKVASFLGVMATGMMIVILLGQIDLSVPWVVTVGAMMACAAASYGEVGSALAIPFGILCGALVGLANGFATAYLRASKDIRGLQDLLGHSSLDTTMRYTLVVADEKRANVARVPALSAFEIAPSAGPQGCSDAQ